MGLLGCNLQPFGCGWVLDRKGVFRSIVSSIMVI